LRLADKVRSAALGKLTVLSPKSREEACNGGPSYKR